MRKFLFTAAVFAVVYAGVNALELVQTGQTSGPGASDVIAAAYRDHASDLRITGGGKVVRVLSDDTNGSQHQRFILRLDSGQTVLVAHNIDLAPRVAGIGEGDTVEFSGEYVWNAQGGVVHWTHHDPQGKHISGWLKHNGRTYQ